MSTIPKHTQLIVTCCCYEGRVWYMHVAAQRATQQPCQALSDVVCCACSQHMICGCHSFQFIANRLVCCLPLACRASGMHTSRHVGLQHHAVMLVPPRKYHLNEQALHHLNCPSKTNPHMHNQHLLLFVTLSHSLAYTMIVTLVLCETVPLAQS